MPYCVVVVVVVVVAWDQPTRAAALFPDSKRKAETNQSSRKHSTTSVNKRSKKTDIRVYCVMYEIACLHGFKNQL
jgi:hypothetical protein